MPAPAKLTDLIDRFERNLAAYKAGQYNETQVRREFIDPFLKLLGWDVDNEVGWAEAYKQVVHEDAIRVGKSAKAPDYSLRIGGQRKLFVEAKKPFVNIKLDIAPAFQVRRYAWSANLPLSILTDFEEFAVYDCRQKPDKADPASHSRVMYFTFREYAEKWEELVSLFSPEAIMRGSFDKYVQDNKGKRGTTVVNDAFLAEISGWRDALAQNIALRNPGITTRQLNFAVQLTIDRLIFLRIAEDRGIEAYGRLRDRAEGTDVYQKLGDLFRQADQKYNSGIFHFTQERGRDDESLDTFTLNLHMDDKVLKQIIKRLYYPDSPYQFDMIPADILGQVYEQFLGKVIRLTAGGRAKVEEKPEVKKAGGVFYTPTYIVDYIVWQTVGKLLAGKKPDGKEGAEKLRILDPACGSGSFLIGAYQYLLDWYLTAYLEDAQKWARRKEPSIYQNANGEWKLTIGERKRILLNNIYGVDIDPQAVEVTKLSLLLKVMEGETEATLGTQLRLLPERVLPDLSANIKCGNSLIGPDFYDGQMSLGIVDEEEMYRINVFDWAAAFPQIVPWGGFDAVIGNPPYVLTQSLNQPDTENFLRRKYRSATYKIDTYQVFIEKALSVTKHNGIVAYITPNTFLRNKFALELRKLFLEQTEIEKLCLFFYSVFDKASVDTVVFVAKKTIDISQDHEVQFFKADEPFKLEPLGKVVQETWNQATDRNFNPPGNELSDALLSKLERDFIKLGDFATAYFGIQTHGRKQYVSDIAIDENWKPVLDGTNINRYSLQPPKEFVCILSEAVKSGGNRNVYEQERIGVRQIGESPVATLLPSGWYSLNTIYNIYFTKEVDYRIEFVLGIISSKTIRWYWSQRFFDQKKTFPKIKKAPLLSIPIRNINFKHSAEVELHDKLVALVKQMLALHQRLAAAQTAPEKSVLQRQITATDRQIDQLVYQLYNLTPEEIAIVEQRP